MAKIVINIEDTPEVSGAKMKGGTVRISVKSDPHFPSYEDGRYSNLTLAQVLALTAVAAMNEFANDNDAHSQAFVTGVDKDGNTVKREVEL